MFGLTSEQWLLLTNADSNSKIKEKKRKVRLYNYEDPSPLTSLYNFKASQNQAQQICLSKAFHSKTVFCCSTACAIKHSRVLLSYIGLSKLFMQPWMSFCWHTFKGYRFKKSIESIMLSETCSGVKYLVTVLKYLFAYYFVVLL